MSDTEDYYESLLYEAKSSNNEEPDGSGDEEIEEKPKKKSKKPEKKEEKREKKPQEMKFCEYPIRQGKRKGEECGNKGLYEIDGKFYCIRHRNMQSKTKPKENVKIEDEDGMELKKAKKETEKKTTEEKPTNKKPKEVELNLDDNEFEAVSAITALNKDDDSTEDDTEEEEEPDPVAEEKEKKVKDFLDFFAYKAFLNINLSGEALLSRLTPLCKGYTNELEKNEYTKSTFEEFMEDCGGEEELLESLTPSMRLLVVMGVCMASTVRNNLGNQPAEKEDPKSLPPSNSPPPVNDEPEPKLLDTTPTKKKVVSTSGSLDEQLMDQFPELFKKK